MKLKNFKPVGNYVLLELRFYNKVGGIITPSPKADKIMQVLAVGDQVKKTKAGEYVLVDDRPMLQLEFPPVVKGGKPVIALLVSEFNIIATYEPDADEDGYLIDIKAPEDQETSRELNVIDNPGIESGSYLKEEAENIKNLRDS